MFKKTLIILSVLFTLLVFCSIGCKSSKNETQASMFKKRGKINKNGVNTYMINGKELPTVQMAQDGQKLTKQQKKYNKKHKKELKKAKKESAKNADKFYKGTNHPKLYRGKGGNNNSNDNKNNNSNTKNTGT